MPRRLENWIHSYMQYAASTESPKIIHFWCAVSAVGGALRRRVWFDQVKFKWFPSFYVVIVGPPGIITKSTSADGSMDLLKQVPGVHFGPDSITWQRLVSAFQDSSESYEYPPGTYVPMSAVTYLASEFGNLIDFQDNDMVNLLITLWDGRPTYAKETKHSGSDMIEGPWINILGCTTPRWINSNMNDNVIGGGFTSRCIFVYGDKKERPVAYIKNMIEDKGKYESLRLDLIHDLEHIATALCGPYSLTEGAEAWGTAWYERLWSEVYSIHNEDYINNYLARKQAHLHKLAIVMAATQHDDMVITEWDLRLAEQMLNTTELDFKHVFNKVGQTEEARHADSLLQSIRLKGSLPYKEVIKLSQLHFPGARDVADLIKGFLDSGQIALGVGPGGTWVTWTGEEDSPTAAPPMPGGLEGLLGQELPAE